MADAVTFADQFTPLWFPQRASFVENDKRSRKPYVESGVSE
jgi:hypothetical protein